MAYELHDWQRQELHQLLPVFVTLGWFFPLLRAFLVDVWLNPATGTAFEGCEIGRKIPKYSVTYRRHTRSAPSQPETLDVTVPKSTPNPRCARFRLWFKDSDARKRRNQLKEKAELTRQINDAGFDPFERFSAVQTNCKPTPNICSEPHLFPVFCRSNIVTLT